METPFLENKKILVVEDELLLNKQITGYLGKHNANVVNVDSFTEAKSILGKQTFDFALVDMNLGDGNGLDLLRDQLFPTHTSVILMTAVGGVNAAVEAIKLGAKEFLTKPFDLDELPHILKRCHQSQQTARLQEHQHNEILKQEEQFFFGSSLSFIKVLLDKILDADRRLSEKLPPVLIGGETGTGKTTIARWLHYNGPRADKTFMEINCSTLTDSLADSELFGHERGAFTHAQDTRIGLFEAADGGTLFLDEIPSLSLANQGKILTAIENHKIRRVGSNHEIPINVRLIVATNKDVRQLVEKREFRDDLYHRLNLFHINIPPLKDRGDDIISLAERILNGLCERYGMQPWAIDDQTKKHLLAYHWPGNVRELSHELERALILGNSDVLKYLNFAEKNTADSELATDHLPTSTWFNENFQFPNTGFSLEDAINQIIKHALNQTDNNVSAAARLLGVSRDYIRYRLSK